MAKYEARIQFSAESDEDATKAAKLAARAANGKVDKVLAERLTFRSLGEEAAK